MTRRPRGRGRRRGATGPPASFLVVAGLALAALSAACGEGPPPVRASGDAGAEPGAEGRPARTLAIFVYDRSTSIPDYQLAAARRLTDRRVRDLGHGDRIAAMEVLQRSLAEPPRRWSQPVPEREFPGREIASDSVSRARFLRDTRDYLRAFTDTAGRGRINGTDLLSTLHDVAAHLRASPDREAVLYVFSDMLQVNRVMNLEGLRRPPPPDWVGTSDRAGKLPDLSGLCVVVVGARIDTEAAQTVKSFWEEYFRATGAELRGENWMYRPVLLPERPCP